MSTRWREGSPRVCVFSENLQCSKVWKQKISIWRPSWHEGQLPICCEEKHSFHVRTVPFYLTSRMESQRTEEVWFPPSIFSRKINIPLSGFLVRRGISPPIRRYLDKNICPTLPPPGSLCFSKWKICQMRSLFFISTAAYLWCLQQALNVIYIQRTREIGFRILNHKMITHIYNCLVTPKRIDKLGSRCHSKTGHALEFPTCDPWR